MTPFVRLYTHQTIASQETTMTAKQGPAQWLDGTMAIAVTHTV